MKSLNQPYDFAMAGPSVSHPAGPMRLAAAMPALPAQRPPAVAGMDFHLSSDLEAGEPPEARGLRRDEVRLMVSYRSSNLVEHTRFRRLPDLLAEGDLLVVNTSSTLKASLPATRVNGEPLELHLSTGWPGDADNRIRPRLDRRNSHWVVEVRQPDVQASKQFLYAVAGETLALPGGGQATLEMPHPRSYGAAIAGQTRLWVARLALPLPLKEYLERYGAAIRYKYVDRPWPTEYYQNVYATEPGSAEMPSAGRAFTPELITQLVARGVQVAPLVLHTGVASLEDHEPPYDEYYRVPEATARLINATREGGGRVVAVGTTVVRALETVTDSSGVTRAGEGWTDLVITPERGIRSVNAMLTGLHEPKATHLAMLEALVAAEHLQVTYGEAVRQRYLWHEFGDLHLMLP